MKQLSFGLLALFLLQNAHAVSDNYLSKEFEAVSNLVRSESLIDASTETSKTTSLLVKGVDRRTNAECTLSVTLEIGQSNSATSSVSYALTSANENHHTLKSIATSETYKNEASETETSPNKISIVTKTKHSLESEKILVTAITTRKKTIGTMFSSKKEVTENQKSIAFTKDGSNVRVDMISYNSITKSCVFEAK